MSCDPLFMTSSLFFIECFSLFGKVGFRDVPGNEISVYVLILLFRISHDFKDF